MNKTLKRLRSIVADIIGIVLTIMIFIVPFYYIIVNSLKSRQESSLMEASLPTQIHFKENYWAVISDQNFRLLKSFVNSTIISAVSISIIILICSMAAYVLQRRPSKTSLFVQYIILIGLMLPPSILPTIWVLDLLGLFPTIPGIILVEVTLQIPFVTMLYRSYMGTIPKEIEEAAMIDGCGKLSIFFKIIFPLLKPATSSVIVLTAVTIFNDFVNPLYFLPGTENSTVSLTIYSFMGQFNSSWNLLFADVVLISIPPLILFLFFNKKIVAGLASSSLKG